MAQIYQLQGKNKITKILIMCILSLELSIPQPQMPKERNGYLQAYQKTFYLPVTTEFILGC